MCRLRPLAGLFFYLLPTLADATTVTGNVRNIAAVPVSRNVFIRIELMNYGPNIPRNTTTQSIIANPTLDVKPDSNGNFSVTVAGTDEIEPAGTFYRICVWFEGRRFRCADFNITGASFDLSTAAPITTVPVVQPPTGDDTYLRLDGGNQYQSNFVPNLEGRDLGALAARWDAFIRDLDVSGAVTGLTGFVPTSRTISTGTGLTGGGDLSADHTFSVVADSTTQRVEVAKNSGATVGTRKRVNFVEGSNVTLTVSDDATNNEVDITVAASGGGSYALQAFTVNSHSPADSTTYYFGLSDNANTLNSKRVPVPKTGRITRWDLQVRVDGLTGTTETVNFWVRLNDSTDNLNIQLSLNAAHVSGSATGSVNVTAGDFLYIKFTTPAWVANPTNVFYFATLYIEP